MVFVSCLGNELSRLLKKLIVRKFSGINGNPSAKETHSLASWQAFSHTCPFAFSNGNNRKVEEEGEKKPELQRKWGNS